MIRDLPVDSTLDTFGLLCPMPIIKTAARMKELQVGNILRVLSDDPGILEDMPAWCITSGNELIGIDDVAGEYHAYIRKVR